MGTQKKIGIWGFGRVGKSVAQMLHAQGHIVSIMARDALTQDDTLFLQDNAIPAYSENEMPYFFNHNDYIVPSPGINIAAHYQTYKDKWLAELDLFYAHCAKPIIAITGTVGKTTTTYLLDQILKSYGIAVATGGNIGTPMCDLLPHQNSAEYALLEVSSFQLEYTCNFAPHIALWTNLTPNHLDRHANYDDYFAAKYKILAHQTVHDKALVPLALAARIKERNPKSAVSYISAQPPTQEELSILHQNDTLFFIDNNQIKKKHGNTITTLIALNALPEITFAENWLAICATLHIMKLPLQQLHNYAQTLAIPEHRMEKLVAPLHNIVFYNDSKSTTTSSTQAALSRLKGKHIILFVGGLSKGVDREPFIKELKDRVKHVYCFGAEANSLSAYCTTYNINSGAFSTLDDAFIACIKNATTNDCILFSPAGSSYDLFKDYEERGTYFKQLVHDFIASDSTT